MPENRGTFLTPDETPIINEGLLETASQGPEGGYLGDPDVVDALVRNVLADCLMLGSVPEDEREAALEKRVDEFASIMLGQNEAFTPVPSWNVTGAKGSDGEMGGVAGFIRRVYMPFASGDEREIIQALIMMGINSILEGYETPDGSIDLEAPNEEADENVQGFIEGAVNLLLGAYPVAVVVL